MKHLDVSTTAQTDVEVIFEHIAAENPGAAVRFGHAARDCFRSLLDNPFLGREYALHSARLWGLRCIGVPGFRNYLAFYTADAAGVTIVRVLHGARDVASILAEDA